MTDTIADNMTNYVHETRQYFQSVVYLSDNPSFPPKEKGNTFEVAIEGKDSILVTYDNEGWKVLSLEDFHLYSILFKESLWQGIVLDTTSLHQRLKEYRETEQQIVNWVIASTKDN